MRSLFKILLSSTFLLSEHLQLFYFLSLLIVTAGATEKKHPKIKHALGGTVTSLVMASKFFLLVYRYLSQNSCDHLLPYQRQSCSLFATH